LELADNSEQRTTKRLPDEPEPWASGVRQANHLYSNWRVPFACHLLFRTRNAGCAYGGM